MNQYNFSLSLKSPEMKTSNLNEANTLGVIDIEREIDTLGLETDSKQF